MKEKEMDLCGQAELQRSKRAIDLVDYIREAFEVLRGEKAFLKTPPESIGYSIYFLSNLVLPGET